MYGRSKRISYLVVFGKDRTRILKAITLNHIYIYIYTIGKVDSSGRVTLLPGIALLHVYKRGPKYFIAPTCNNETSKTTRKRK